MTGIIIYALATFGLSSLLTEYDGPKDIFYKLRDKYPKSFLKCTVCTSVWVALLLLIPILLGFGYYLAPLSAVGVVILLERL